MLKSLIYIYIYIYIHIQYINNQIMLHSDEENRECANAQPAETQSKRFSAQNHQIAMHFITVQCTELTALRVQPKYK